MIFEELGEIKKLNIKRQVFYLFDTLHKKSFISTNSENKTVQKFANNFNIWGWVFKKGWEKKMHTLDVFLCLCT